MTMLNLNRHRSQQVALTTALLAAAVGPDAVREATASDYLGGGWDALQR
jgi:hypothetical protein